MKALRLIETGAPLELVELERPEPGIGEILIRVAAAGICHSDVHYRNGTSKVGTLPITPGHEISGLVESVGPGATHLRPGDRVCVHYLRSCGRCAYCSRGKEQFCVEGMMIGKDCDGGYAEFVAVPERSVFRLPDTIPFPQAAVMMCSSSTALHALRVAELSPGETLAVFGIGGLGMSCIQIARSFAPRAVFAVDIDEKKLRMAERYGARPVSAGHNDPAEEIRRLTDGRGVDVAVELIGLPATMGQAVESLAVFGRAALAGISDRPFEVRSYKQLIGKEARIVGVSDHLAAEIPLLIDLVESGTLEMEHIEAVAFDAASVNRVLDHLEQFSAPVRSFIEFGIES